MDQNSDFYTEQISILDELSELANPSVYTPMPNDWFVLVADVKNSTQAIESGFYKEVNGVGAACIAAIINACKPIEVPYVFGGDGASFCIPNSMINECRSTLSAVRSLSREAFGLELRVAAIPLSKIREQGRDVKVAKLKVSEGYSQACFLGGGLDYAEQIIKHPTEGASFSIGEYPGAKADYTGFECRWDEVKSDKEEIISLLVKPISQNESEIVDIYTKVFAHIESIYGSNPEDNPISVSKLKTTLNPKKLSVEGKIVGFNNGKKTKTGIVWFKSFVGRIWGMLDTTSWGVSWMGYKKIVWQNSDYRKIDDMFRMILSGTTEQRNGLIFFLDQLKRDNLIYYGFHVSQTALITCLIFERKLRHSHLIDGSHGGYAMAAKMLKEQMALL